MVEPTPDRPSASPAMETYLLGRVDFAQCLAMQRQLLRQVAVRDDGQVVLLLCEHPEVITIGRGGAALHVAGQSPSLRSHRLPSLYVNRGGGAMLHCPGQLAIYPILPLWWHRLSVGAFLRRLQTAVIETLDELRIRGAPLPGRWGIWGRTGQLAMLGAAVRYGVTYFGAYLNVCPPMGLFRLVETDPIDQTRMSLLVAERQGHVRMTTVRAALIPRLADALGCDRYHLYTGHPLLGRDNETRNTV